MGFEIQDNTSIKKRVSINSFFLLLYFFLFSSILLPIAGASSGGFVVNRTLSEDVVNPGDTFSVKLEILARDRVFAPAITEKLPEGWTSVPVKKAGALFKASTNEWIWLGGLGPEEERVLVYEVQVPQNSLPGVYTLRGRFSAGRGSESGGFVGPFEIGGVCKIEVESGDRAPVDSSAESRVSSDRSKGFRPEKARLNQSYLFKLDSGPLNKEAEVNRIDAGTDDGNEILKSGIDGTNINNNSTEGVTTPGFSFFSSMISLLISLLILKTNYSKTNISLQEIVNK